MGNRWTHRHVDNTNNPYLGVVPSEEQQNIIDLAAKQEHNIIVKAVAGSGKTFLLLSLAEVIRRLDRSGIFLAFQSDVASRLNSFMPSGQLKAQTIHSLGFAALRANRRIYPLAGEVEKFKYNNLVRTYMDARYAKFKKEDYKTYAEAMRAAKKMVDFGRESVIKADDAAGVKRVLIEYGLNPSYPNQKQQFIFDEVLTPDLYKIIVDLGEEAIKTRGAYDFSDMIYWACVDELAVPQYDFVLIDELQDLSEGRKNLALRAIQSAGTMVGVGDDRQAIFHFAGAKSNSMDTITTEVNAQVLPLSTNRRCGRLHLDRVRSMVPSILPRPDAPMGEVIYDSMMHFIDRVKTYMHEDLLIISRYNVTLVGAALELAKNRIPARVLGRDVNQDLMDVLDHIETMSGFTYSNFLYYVDSYMAAAITKYMQDDETIPLAISISDKCQSVAACFRSFKSKDLETLRREITELCQPDRNGIVKLSTVHRAKGNEADIVMILKSDELPVDYEHQTAEQYQQEQNLWYVAGTRPRKVLINFGGENEDMFALQRTITEAMINLKNNKKAYQTDTGLSPSENAAWATYRRNLDAYKDGRTDDVVVVVDLPPIPIPTVEPLNFYGDGDGNTLYDEGTETLFIEDRKAMLAVSKRAKASGETIGKNVRRVGDEKASKILNQLKEMSTRLFEELDETKPDEQQ